MDFNFSEEQNSLRELARTILEDQSTHERLKEIEKGSDWFDRQLWSELAKANLLGVALEEQYGGSGFGFFEACLLLQEVGRTVAAIPLIPSMVMTALPLQAFGSDKQKAEFLPRIADGSLILSAALEEFGSNDPTKITHMRPTRRQCLCDRRRKNISSPQPILQKACWCQHE